VPWSASGSLDIGVALEGGARMSLCVPVEPYDFLMRGEGLSWEYHGTNAGDTISVESRLFKDSGTSFSHCGDALRLVFVVNGVASEPVKPSSSSVYGPGMATANYSFKIPQNCVWPLDLKVAADAGGLFDETREGNNIAAVSIPKAPAGDSGPSVAAADVWCLPAAAVPGETVQLFAAVRNDSAAAASGMTLNFSVNGVQLDPGNAVYRGSIQGGQYHVFQEKWTVPDSLTADPVFSFNIIPGTSLSGDSASDNASVLVLPLARPDLSVRDLGAIGDGGARLSNSGTAHLTAVVENSGGRACQRRRGAL
jgi:hypothetical protein